jgi:hypothetical protein
MQQTAHRAASFWADANINTKRQHQHNATVTSFLTHLSQTTQHICATVAHHPSLASRPQFTRHATHKNNPTAINDLRRTGSGRERLARPLHYLPASSCSKTFNPLSQHQLSGELQ